MSACETVLSQFIGVHASTKAIDYLHIFLLTHNLKFLLPPQQSKLEVRELSKTLHDRHQYALWQCYKDSGLTRPTNQAEGPVDYLSQLKKERRNASLADLFQPISISLVVPRKFYHDHVGHVKMTTVIQGLHEVTIACTMSCHRVPKAKNSKPNMEHG